MFTLKHSYTNSPYFLSTLFPRDTYFLFKKKRERERRRKNKMHACCIFLYTQKKKNFNVTRVNNAVLM